MLKFVGAMVAGCTAVACALYFVARSKEQRGSDMSTLKNVAVGATSSVKNYVSELINTKGASTEAI